MGSRLVDRLFEQTTADATSPMLWKDGDIQNVRFVRDQPSDHESNQPLVPRGDNQPRERKREFAPERSQAPRLNERQAFDFQDLRQVVIRRIAYQQSAHAEEHLYHADLSVCSASVLHT